MRSHLLNDTTAEHYRRSVTAGVERVAARLATTDRPFTGVTRRRARPRRRRDRPRPAAAATRPPPWTSSEDVYLRDAVYFHHPRYLAHLNCPVVIPAVLGEAVLSAVNSSLDTWDQSAGGTLIERRLIDWTADRIGLGPAADGVFTSGGTQSNLQALLLAREEAKLRPASSARLRIFTSEVQPLQRAEVGQTARPRTGRRRLRPRRPRPAHAAPSALARELERCGAEGLVPMAVVATAGTTDFGSIDPLPEIAALCEQYGDLDARRRRVRLRAAGLARPAGTCSTASSAPTRSPSTTTSRSSSR